MDFLSKVSSKAGETIQTIKDSEITKKAKNYAEIPGLQVQIGKEEAAIKKGLDFSPVKLLVLTEGKCVQIMHHGSYDDEPATIAKMHQFIAKNDLGLDFSDQRRHHEIYLSNSQRTKLENLKTIICLPVKEKKMKND